MSTSTRHFASFEDMSKKYVFQGLEYQTMLFDYQTGKVSVACIPSYIEWNEFIHHRFYRDVRDAIAGTYAAYHHYNLFEKFRYPMPDVRAVFYSKNDISRGEEPTKISVLILN